MFLVKIKNVNVGECQNHIREVGQNIRFIKNQV